MKWLEKITGGYSSSARVVDGTLVLSLPDAMAPVVWRMDLGQVKSSALEVREKEDGSFVLTLKTPKGDVTDIAPFAERGRALKALMAVSAAMEHAHGHIRPAARIVANDEVTGEVSVASARKGRGGSLVAGVVAVLILVVAVTLLMRAAATSTALEGMVAGAAQPAAGGDMSGATGVPLSADEFLMNR